MHRRIRENAEKPLLIAGSIEQRIPLSLKSYQQSCCGVWNLRIRPWDSSCSAKLMFYYYRHRFGYGDIMCPLHEAPQSGRCLNCYFVQASLADAGRKRRYRQNRCAWVARWWKGISASLKITDALGAYSLAIIFSMNFHEKAIPYFGTLPIL